MEQLSVLGLQPADLTQFVGGLGSSLGYSCSALVLMVIGALLIVVPSRGPSARRPERPARATFAERVAALGLAAVDGGWEGQVGGRRVRITRFDDPTVDPPVTIELATPVPTGSLVVGAGDPEQTAIRGSRHVGDSEFDPWFEVQGEPEEVALLSADVRRALRNSARTSRPRIEKGWLTIGGSGTVDLDGRLAPLVAVASALEQGMALDPAHRMKRFASDPESGVRLRCLETLQSRSASPSAQLVARSRLDDPDPVVRTLAAVILKDSQRLVTIAKSADQSAGVRRRAARALLQAGTEEERMEAAAALASGPTPLHSVAYELSGSLGSAAEPVLIQLVGSDNAEVARDAASHLAKIGSIKGMPALREFRERTATKVSMNKEITSAIEVMRKATPGPRRSDAPTRPLRAGVDSPVPDLESPTGRRPQPVRTGTDHPVRKPEPPPDDRPARPTTERRTPAQRTIKRR